MAPTIDQLEKLKSAASALIDRATDEEAKTNDLAGSQTAFDAAQADLDAKKNALSAAEAARASAEQDFETAYAAVVAASGITTGSSP